MRQLSLHVNFWWLYRWLHWRNQSMIDRLEISATVYRPELTLEIHSVCLTGPSVTWNYRRARWVIALSIGKLLNPSHLVCYVRVLIVIEIRYGFHSFSLPFFFFSIIVHPTIFTELITRTTTTTDIRISFFSSLRIYEYVLFTSLINICPEQSCVILHVLYERRKRTF